MLELKNIIAGYKKDNHILKGVDLTVAENEVVAIVGQNGAGKSTLAKAIMNMLPFISGEILFNGEDITGKSTQEIVGKGIQFFMQGGRIFPHLTVNENLNFSGLGLPKNDFKKRKKEVMSYFDLFQNGKMRRLNMQASYLSGGEQHQLALAMVLMKKPKILILDEPSAGLSPGNVKKLYDILIKVGKNENINLLLIEQNIKFALDNSNRTVVLDQGVICRDTTTLIEIENLLFKKSS